MSRWRLVRTHALMKKGLRLSFCAEFQRRSRSNTCPDEEGIKTCNGSCTRHSTAVRTHALMKKGLRQETHRDMRALGSSNTCPDEEGIKTIGVELFHKGVTRSNTCPDEEGIKTSSLPRAPVGHVVRTHALMKKGLRQRPIAGRRGSCCSNTCPDEEGIKTSPIL